MLWCSISPAVAQVSIDSARWGFDGTSVVGRFNILTVHVRNRGNEPFDGPVRLSQMDQVIGGPGARHAQRCYLAPGSSRMIRFYPYLASPDSWWTVSVGNVKRRFAAFADPNEVRVLDGEPATIILRSKGALAGAPVGIPEFPEQEFPESVAATGGLGRVILDHAPEFLPVQTTAFLDWLRSGGELHVMYERDAFPVFEGKLGLLNDPRPRFAIGSGVVIREARKIARGDPLADLARNLRRKQARNATAQTGRLLKGLGEVVRPDHNWALIYVVIFLFFLAVVPGHAWLSFKRLGYAGSIGTLITIVAVFTWALFYIGKRGYGESSVVHSISYAKVLDQGRYDVFQYKNLFSTTSTTQAIRHTARGSLYSAATHDEYVSGRLFHGSDAHFSVSVPLFTSRPFVHRGVMVADPVSAEVTGLEQRRPLNDGLRIRWVGPPVLHAFAFHGTRAVRLRFDAGYLVPQGQAIAHKTLFGTDGRNFNLYSGFNRHLEFGAGANPSDIIQRYAPIIIAERWGVKTGFSATEWSGPRSLRLVVVCHAPDEFKIRKTNDPTNVGTEHGFVMYDMTIQEGN